MVTGVWTAPRFLEGVFGLNPVHIVLVGRTLTASTVILSECVLFQSEMFTLLFVYFNFAQQFSKASVRTQLLLMYPQNGFLVNNYACNLRKIFESSEFCRVQIRRVQQNQCAKVGGVLKSQ